MGPGEPEVKPEDRKHRSMNLEQFQPWLGSGESRFMLNDFRDLFRFGDMLGLLLERCHEAQIALDVDKSPKSTSCGSESPLLNLAKDAGQRLSKMLSSLVAKLTQNPIRFDNDEAAEFAWRSLIICCEDAVSIATEISSKKLLPDIDASNGQHASQPVRAPGPKPRRILPDDQTEDPVRKTSESHESSVRSQTLNAQPADESAAISVNLTTSEITPFDLLRSLDTLNRYIGSIFKHFDLLRSWCTSSPRFNRLGLSEIQLDILRTLHPDKLLTAYEIAEELGIPLNKRGVVPFIAQVKPEGALRRLGLIETQKGPEGGYYLSPHGREVLDEYLGIDPTSGRSDVIAQHGETIRKQTNKRGFRQILGDEW